uniref:Uncharacterized protein n=2 Tax=Caenorhabditis japonica TaxID=281687 RepID=A0A8R1IS83_CAEJA
MSPVWMILVLIACHLLCGSAVSASASDTKNECSVDCDQAPSDLGIMLPPELFDSTRLANLIAARPALQFKMKRDYDFVRFGRSAPSKKASYDYIRFGRK